MIKQVDFQIASYFYPLDLDRMREEVKDMQKSGWEVQAPLHLGLRKDENGRDVEIVLVPMIKYAEVDDTAKAATVKKVGRPKKVVE